MTTRPRAAIRRRIAVAGAAFVALVVGATVAAYACRDSFASAVATHELASAGLTCDRVSVRVPAAFPPTSARVAPMRCTSADGPLASVRFAAPLVVRIDGLRVRSVSCDSVDVDLRPQHREVALNTLGALSGVIGLSRPTVDLVLDWAELSRLPLPPFSARHAIIRRSGQRVVEMRDMVLRPERTGQSLSAREARIDAAGILGAGTLTGRATPQRASIRLRFSAMHAEVVGRRLSSPRPTVDFAVGLGDGEASRQVSGPARHASMPR